MKRDMIRQAFDEVDKELQKLVQIQNFITALDKGLLYPERFVMLVRSVIAEGSEG